MTSLTEINNQTIIELAKSLGFVLVGFAKAEPLKEEISHLKDWLEKGRHHKMLYMEKNIAKREDVSKILSSAKSVISLGINYFKEGDYEKSFNSGKVSRYAWGKDYHLILWEKLKVFTDELMKINETTEICSYVDTGPVMDKVWAVKSGLGWMGKNTNVISRKIGSWFFIATVITNLELESDFPQPDLCGTCTACIDACPTNALDAYVLDTCKCISNLTIENRGVIPERFRGKFENWIFGCDICQEVCPWNKKYQNPSHEPDFNSIENKEIYFNEINEMTNSKFKKKFAESPIVRIGLKGLKRNADFLEEKLY